MHSKGDKVYPIRFCVAFTKLSSCLKNQIRWRNVLGEGGGGPSKEALSMIGRGLCL